MIHNGYAKYSHSLSFYGLKSNGFIQLKISSSSFYLPYY